MQIYETLRLRQGNALAFHDALGSNVHYFTRSPSTQLSSTAPRMV